MVLIKSERRFFNAGNIMPTQKTKARIKYYAPMFTIFFNFRPNQCTRCP